MARCSIAPIFVSKHANAGLDVICEAELDALSITVVEGYLARKGLSVAGTHKSLRERLRAHVAQQNRSTANETWLPVMTGERLFQTTGNLKRSSLRHWVYKVFVLRP